MTTSPEPREGDRVTFLALGDDGDTICELTGTVFRPVWGRGRNVSIRTDNGATYVRMADDVTVHQPEQETRR